MPGRQVASEAANNHPRFTRSPPSQLDRPRKFPWSSNASPRLAHLRLLHAVTRIDPQPPRPTNGAASPRAGTRLWQGIVSATRGATSTEEAEKPPPSPPRGARAMDASTRRQPNGRPKHASRVYTAEKAGSRPEDRVVHTCHHQNSSASTF